MLHRECGRANPNAPCMEKGSCDKFFPKDFNVATTWSEHEIYPKYRRRSPSQGGAEYVMQERSGRSRVVNNSWVVPYSPYLYDNGRYRTANVVYRDALSSGGDPVPGLAGDCNAGDDWRGCDLGHPAAA